MGGDSLCTNMDVVVGVTDMHQTKVRGENFFGYADSATSEQRGTATTPQLVRTMLLNQQKSMRVTPSEERSLPTDRLEEIVPPEKFGRRTRRVIHR